MRSTYAAGHLAKSLAWSFTDLLLAYYLNMRLGLSAQETGLILFFSMTLGAGLDVLVAFLLRRVEGCRRQIVLIQLIAGLATGVALVTVFSPMRGHTAASLSLLPALALFRLAFSFYDVAQNALVSLLPENAEDARRYVVWRQAGGALARIGVAASGFLLFGAGGGEIFAASGIAVLIALTAAALSSRSAAAQTTQAVAPRRWLATPPDLPRLLLAGAALAGPLSLAVRMVTFVTEREPYAIGGAALLLAFVSGTLIGPFVLPKRTTAVTRIAITVLTVIAIASFLADSRSGLLALAACLAHGIGLGALMTLFWGMTSAAVRDHADHSGVRTDLTAFALVTATIKLSGALSGLMLGMLLDGFKCGDPATMAVLAAISAAGGVLFVLTSAPPRPRGAPV